MKACPNCHSKYPDDANFCPQETCATPEGPRRLVPVPADPAPRFPLTSELGGGPSDEVKGLTCFTPRPATETVFGVPEYLAPEQAEGKLVDQRSNTYSLGAILHLMLTGQPPVSGADTAAILAQVREGIVTPPSQLRQGLTPEIDRVVLKSMEKKSSRRPLTMRQFLAQ